MVERLLVVKSALSSILEELEWDNLAISEWKTLDSIKTLLQPFAQFTSLISGEDLTTVSSVIPAIMDINIHLEEVCVILQYYSVHLFYLVTCVYVLLAEQAPRCKWCSKDIAI